MRALGDLFNFYVRDNIIRQDVKINPYDQPAVELIKRFKKILI